MDGEKQALMKIDEMKQFRAGKNAPGKRRADNDRATPHGVNLSVAIMYASIRV